MTRPLKKNFERFFAEEAARHVGKNWALSADRERPDFIRDRRRHKFGLEVTEIFTGPSGRAGSSMKRAESESQWTINSLRMAYEKTANVPLRVQFVGSLYR